MKGKLRMLVPTSKEDYDALVKGIEAWENGDVIPWEQVKEELRLRGREV